MQIDTSEHTRIYMNNHKRGIGDNTRLKELNGGISEKVKKKSTENYDGLPYITTLLSISLWTLYGILDPDDGILITTVKSMSLLGILVGVLGTVIAVTRLAFHGSARHTFVGVLCATLTIAMKQLISLHVYSLGSNNYTKNKTHEMCLLLVALINNHETCVTSRTVIRMKSMEYMPFFLTFSLFLYVSVWFSFSMLVKDNYVLVPNAVGIVLGLAQLIVYMIYKNKSSLSILKSMSVIEDRGSNQITSLLFYTFYQKKLKRASRCKILRMMMKLKQKIMDSLKEEIFGAISRQYSLKKE
ncbi:hypothetical protein ACSBR2_001523 [Camellia fascicularis]